jgi:CBS domain-containing protein
MLIKDFMTKAPVSCRPWQRLDEVAQLMSENDCGEIPVCEGSRIVGVITDRDIACRAVAAGMIPVAIPAGDVMTKTVFTVEEDDTIDTALDLMQTNNIRRIPVVDARRELVGMVSVSDLAVRAPARVAAVLAGTSKNTKKSLVSVP